MRVWCGILFISAICAGCERSKPTPATAPAPPAQADATPAQLPAMECQISVVAPILPKKPTHITIDPSSNIYYVQELEDGGDTLFIVGSGDVSNALPLSARSVLGTIDEKGSGNIQSIAAGSDGNIYFFFTGGTLKKTVACFGRFETRTGIIRILAREDQLAKVSGLGVSLALARGTIVSSGKVLWLWLHHSDASAMFQLRPREVPPEGELLLPRPMTLRSRDGTLDMNRTEVQIAPGAGESMLMLDLWTAALWKADITGSADVVQSLVGLPKLLSVPGANQLGDIVFFAAPAEPIEPRVDQRVAPVDVQTHYPSLMILRGGKITPVPRDDIHAGPGIPLNSMQLDQMLYEAGRDAWIGYDAASGQIVRMRLLPKRAR